MGREPKTSTLNTLNFAINRIFYTSVARGFMNKTHVPMLIKNGRDGGDGQTLPKKSILQ